MQLPPQLEIEDAALFEAVDLDDLVGIRPLVRRGLFELAKPKLANGVLYRNKPNAQKPGGFVRVQATQLEVGRGATEWTGNRNSRILLVEYLP